MSIIPAKEIFYPESDGKPMADNSRQLDWIFMFVGNLRALYRDHPNVFVGGNQNWYPVEGEPGIVQAPDAYVVFGRPKGHRGSYKQWEEGDVPMTVVFEVLSPGNTVTEMIDKQEFYREHGVEEYYLFDPDRNDLIAFLRRGSEFRRQRLGDGFTSPRLGIRFDLSGPEMIVRYPDGRPFLPFDQLAADYQRLETEWKVAEDRAAQAQQQAAQAQQQAAQAQQQAAQAQQRLARLIELGRKARLGQATEDELAELERLEAQP